MEVKHVDNLEVPILILIEEIEELLEELNKTSDDSDEYCQGVRNAYEVVLARLKSIKDKS